MLGCFSSLSSGLQFHGCIAGFRPFLLIFNAVRVLSVQGLLAAIILVPGLNVTGLALTLKDERTE